MSQLIAQLPRNNMFVRWKVATGPVPILVFESDVKPAKAVLHVYRSSKLGPRLCGQPLTAPIAPVAPAHALEPRHAADQPHHEIRWRSDLGIMFEYVLKYECMYEA